MQRLFIAIIIIIILIVTGISFFYSKFKESNLNNDNQPLYAHNDLEENKSQI